MYNKTWREKRVNLNAGEKAVMYFDETIKPNTFIFVGSSQNIVVSTEREVSEQHYEMLINKNDTQIFAKPKNINALYIGNFGKEVASFLLYYSFGEFDANLLKRTNGTVTIDGILPAGENHIGNVGIDRALPAGNNHLGQVSIDKPIPPGNNYIGTVGLSNIDLDFFNTELPAGENHIGNVGIDRALPAGNNHLGQVSIDKPIPPGNNYIGTVGLSNIDLDSFNTEKRIFPVGGTQYTINGKQTKTIPLDFGIDKGTVRYIFKLSGFYIRSNSDLDGGNGFIRLTKDETFGALNYNPRLLFLAEKDGDENVYHSDNLCFILKESICSKIDSFTIENFEENDIQVYMELYYTLVRKAG